MTDLRTVKLGQLYAGPYVDGRQGLVLHIPNGDIAHLTPEQCRQLAQLLNQVLADHPTTTAGETT